MRNTLLRWAVVKRIIKKTLAIAEKQIYMKLRFKLRTIIHYFLPIITILMPIIVLGKFFEYNVNFGPWDSQNYIIFVFTGYNILLFKQVISYIPNQMKLEQYWKTLTAVLVAPFNRYYLLFGYFLSEMVFLAIPFLAFFITLLIIYQISFATVLVILLIFLGILLVFTAIGLFLAMIHIANESIFGIIDILIDILFWLSCITYPFLLFPNIVQNFISLNPIYYLVDLVRVLWLENNVLLTFINHSGEFLIVGFSIIIAPILSVFMFNIIYKKLGAKGY
ncbi:MAG: hypothetical protein ACFFA4_07695 [Promethearchaeota archaeon]